MNRAARAGASEVPVMVVNIIVLDTLIQNIWVLVDFLDYTFCWLIYISAIAGVSA